MKIAVLCSSGGHLSEMMCLKEAWGKYDHFFISYKDVRTEAIKDRKYLMTYPEEHPFSYPLSIVKLFGIMIKEKPDVMISTGFGWMDIWLFFFAKFTRTHTIYIESWCMIDSITGTANLVRRFADEFLVQWPELAEKLGDGVGYRGRIL